MRHIRNKKTVRVYWSSALGRGYGWQGWLVLAFHENYGCCCVYEIVWPGDRLYTASAILLIVEK